MGGKKSYLSDIRTAECINTGRRIGYLCVSNGGLQVVSALRHQKCTLLWPAALKDSSHLEVFSQRTMNSPNTDREPSNAVNLGQNTDEEPLSPLHFCGNRKQLPPLQVVGDSTFISFSRVGNMSACKE